MEVNVKAKKANPLLEREEVEFEVNEAMATPSRKEIRLKLAAVLNADENSIIVDALETRYGARGLNGVARVYKSPEQLKKTELAHITVRNFGKQAKGPGEKAESAVDNENKEGSLSEDKGRRAEKDAPKAEEKT